MNAFIFYLLLLDLYIYGIFLEYKPFLFKYYLFIEDFTRHLGTR